MKWGALAVASCTAAIAAIPGVGYLLDPLLRRQRQKSTWYPVSELATLAVNTPTAVAVLGEQVDAWTRSPMQRIGTVWLTREASGTVTALSAECPHLGCRVQYRPDRTQYTCPCHESSFSEAGVALTGPSPRALDALPTRVRNGKVEVRFKRFRLQVAEKIELGS
ncbi:MAG: Rieske (2Fe-2S) protein [Myxococcales bacterium]|nr:Rieske (2Fe-2S) protein [Myxococcales bacterium]